MRRLLTLALASVLLSVVAHAEPQQVAIPVCRIGQLSAGCLDHLIPTLGDRVFVSDASATDTCASVAAPTGRKYFVLCILTTSGWQPDPDGAVGDGSAISASSTDTLTNKTVLGGDSLANTAPSTNTVRKRSHATDCRTLTVAAAMVKGDECYDADNLMSWVCATPATGGDASYCDATGEWLTTGWNTDTYLTGSGIQLGTNDYIEFHAEASAAGHTRLYLGEEDGYLMLQLPGAPAGPTLYATVATVPSPLPVNECVKFGATGLLEGTGIDCGTMTMHGQRSAWARMAGPSPTSVGLTPSVPLSPEPCRNSTQGHSFARSYPGGTYTAYFDVRSWIRTVRNTNGSAESAAASCAPAACKAPAPSRRAAPTAPRTRSSMGSLGGFSRCAAAVRRSACPRGACHRYGCGGARVRRRRR